MAQQVSDSDSSFRERVIAADEKRTDRKFMHSETGIMTLELDAFALSRNDNRPDTWRKMKEQAVIDFSKGTITITNGKKDVYTLYFSEHGKEYMTWTNPYITEMYHIRAINWGPHIRLTQNREAECYISIVGDAVDIKYHIKSITRKTQ